MGLLDDAASAISVGGRSSHSGKKSRSHRDHKSSSHRHRSRSRSRGGHHSSSAAGGGLGGIAASLFGGGGGDKHSSSSSDSDRRKKKSHHKSSGGGSIFGLGDDYKKHSASRSSFFGIPTGGHSSGRSPSYYKRSPRPSFVTRVVRRLKRLLRDLVYYAKRHPLKVFMLVVMPLVTGGFLTALLARFGLKLPAAVTRLIGLAGRAAAGDSVGLVGEAVKMASSSSGTGGGRVAMASVSVERGRDGGGSWERKRVERDIVGGSGGGMGWGTLAAVGKMFS